MSRKESQETDQQFLFGVRVGTTKKLKKIWGGEGQGFYGIILKPNCGDGSYKFYRITE